MNRDIIKRAISAIDTAFDGMKERQEEEVLVTKISDIQRITLRKDTIDTTTVTVKLSRKNDKKHIVLACDNRSINIIFTGTCREHVVETLHSNNILPSVEEFLEARSLANTPGIARMVGGDDYEDAITRDAKRYLEKK